MYLQNAKQCFFLPTLLKKAKNMRNYVVQAKEHFLSHNTFKNPHFCNLVFVTESES